MGRSTASSGLQSLYGHKKATAFLNNVSEMVSFVIKTCRVIRMTHSETFVIEDSSNSQFSPAWNQNANLHPCTNVFNFIGEN